MKKVIILENIRSIHNVGAIFRTADGAGFDKIFCSGYTPDPTDLRMKKVSLGAEDFIGWKRAKSCLEICKKLKENDFLIIAIEKNECSKNLFDFKKQNKNIALIFGNEVEGISKEVLDFSDHVLEIPMLGKKESLNVSVASGIALYNFI